MDLVYLNGEGGIPIAATLERHPAGVMGIRRVVSRAQLHSHGENCGCTQVTVTDVHWKIRADGTVGCTPGWTPCIFQGKLVMFAREAE